MGFIEALGVDKSYVVGATRLPVLQGLTLSVEKGEMVAIVGASGVGRARCCTSSAALMPSIAG